MEHLFTQKKGKKYYPLMLRQLAMSVLIFKVAGSYAQAPTISYVSPQTYTQSATITPLVPTSSGVASFGYANTVTQVPIAGINRGANGLAFDSNGNLFVASGYSKSTIEEFPAGGGAVIAYGPVFQGPFAVATDINNNVYVADYAGHTVYKIPAGGGAAVTLSTAIQNPYGIAVDRWGNVYVTDYNLGYLWKLPAKGAPSVLGSYGVQSLQGVAVDDSGNIYFSYVNYSARKSIMKIPATGGPAVVVSTAVSYPYGLTVDHAGNIFVADGGSNRIVMLPAGGGSVVNIAPGSSVSTTCVALDGRENLYLSDIGAQYPVDKINRTGGYFISPDLPAGLSFDESTGTISGTPTTVSPATNYTVTAYNSSGQTSTTVNITVSPALNSHFAGLSSLKLSAGVLSPAFSPTTTSYTATVVNGVRSLVLTPGTPSHYATIRINGEVVADSTASAPIPLAVGIDTISIVVTAPDGVTTKTYTLTVNRPGSSNDNLSALNRSAGTLSPAFSPATTSYTSNVVNGVRSITITPTGADPDATITVNGTPITIIGPGPAAAQVPLSVGTNTINIAVTSSNGTATQTYTLTVNRPTSTNDNLRRLYISNGILYPSFSPGITSYSATVGPDLPSMTVEPHAGDPDATITVDGTVVASGSTSGRIPLSFGSNTINIVVTASDGTTSKTYSLTITRPTSNDAYLSSLRISNGTLNTGYFSYNHYDYTTSVSYADSIFTVTPIADDPYATIKVNGTAVLTRHASGPILLAVGSNTVNIVVTASDGATTLTYTVTVTRSAGPANIFDAGVRESKPMEAPELADDGVQVHQAVSPNGDGINDFLQIDNIAKHPENKLLIMNNNGQLIFEAKGYDNTSKVFDGHSSKNGQMQLPGTYFYQLDYTASGIVKHKTGYLVLKY